MRGIQKAIWQPPEGRGPNQREPWNLPGLSSCKATVRSTMPPLFREFKSNLFFLPVLSREMHHYFSWVCLIQAAASLLRVNVVVCSLFTLRILCFYTSKLLAFNTWTCLIGFICMGTKNLMFLIILLLSMPRRCYCPKQSLQCGQP